VGRAGSARAGWAATGYGRGELGRGGEGGGVARPRAGSGRGGGAAGPRAGLVDGKAGPFPFLSYSFLIFCSVLFFPPFQIEFPIKRMLHKITHPTK
jgi:hypothetical protein